MRMLLTKLTRTCAEAQPGGENGGTLSPHESNGHNQCLEHLTWLSCRGVVHMQHPDQSAVCTAVRCGCCTSETRHFGPRRGSTSLVILAPLRYALETFPASFLCFRICLPPNRISPRLSVDHSTLLPTFSSVFGAVVWGALPALNKKRGEACSSLSKGCSWIFDSGCG